MANDFMDSPLLRMDGHEPKMFRAKRFPKKDALIDLISRRHSEVLNHQEQLVGPLGFEPRTNGL